MRISDWSSDVCSSDLAAGLGTYYAYVKAIDLPQVVPYAGRIRMAGYLGFGLPLLAGALLLVLILKPSKKSLHGNARFAHAGDLARTGMFKESDTGLLVGQLNGHLVQTGRPSCGARGCQYLFT